MYAIITAAALSSAGQCNGSFQAPVYFQPGPPVVFEYRQFRQLPVFENYRPYSFQQQQFPGPYSFQGYSAPAWSPSSAWSPPRAAYGYQQSGVNFSIGPRRFFNFNSYSNGYQAPQICPTCP